MPLISSNMGSVCNVQKAGGQSLRLRVSKCRIRDLAGAGGRAFCGGCSPQRRISNATFLKWKSKFGVMHVTDAKRLRLLEDEDAKQSLLPAETLVDNSIMKGVNCPLW